MKRLNNRTSFQKVIKNGPKKNKQRFKNDCFDKKADCFLDFMMDNFDTELTVMGAKIALSTYKLPMKPSKLKSFTKFHKNFGKYVVASMENA